jgi:hypothetical protein
MAALANGPRPEPTCTPGGHLGDDGAGRCSVCNARLSPSDLRPVGLLLMAVSAVIVLTIVGTVIWWAIG